ncbi:uncharacterized protein LOC121831357 [Peromyscus maniculatus bairdii]|uniref:uncharacterized protein LOC121831357 n=1 Tax=Peromyscus maniculatus bairdii TaxID=230844 RepID=UPI001C2E766E|nr:uncharacterized protein LOC121831357 [Peromyscus maniculatus bairdii]XP_042138320.1 uncharacterized protein LOC121831357 [Peromyscus maniculatus bairdii]
MMTTKNIAPASKPVTYVLLQTSSEGPKATNKSSKTNKSRGSFLKTPDSVRKLSKQLPGNCENFFPEAKNVYCLDICPFVAGKILDPEPQPHIPIPAATETYIPENATARLQLMDQAYGFRKNINPVLYPPRNAPTVSAMNTPSADAMKVSSISVMKAASSADAVKVPSASVMKTPSADVMKVPSIVIMKPPSTDVIKYVSSTEIVKAPHLVASKQLFTWVTKPRTKNQPKNQKKQDKEKHLLSLDLVLVNRNRLTPAIQHLPIPEATKVIIRNPCNLLNYHPINI